MRIQTFFKTKLNKLITNFNPRKKNAGAEPKIFEEKNDKGFALLKFKTSYKMLKFKISLVLVNIRQIYQWNIIKSSELHLYIYLNLLDNKNISHY